MRIVGGREERGRYRIRGNQGGRYRILKKRGPKEAPSKVAHIHFLLDQNHFLAIWLMIFSTPKSVEFGKF